MHELRHLTSIKERIMKLYKVVTSIIFCIFVSACTSKNVTFYQDIEKNAQNTDSIRIHIDAFGSIYPNEKGIVSFEKNLGESASLYNQFITNNAVCTDSNTTLSSNTRNLCKAIEGMTPESYDNQILPNEEWRDAQSKIWEITGTKIFNQASAQDRDILFLIHGFNNTFSDSSKNFQVIKNKVRAMATQNKEPLIIEIYWDGFEGLPLSGAWGKAQTSGPLIGFQMRQLLSHIQTKYETSQKRLPELMFITHSSGAFVAGSLLGNPYAVLPLLHNEDKVVSPEYLQFRQLRAGNHKKFPIPNFPKIRLGMIAAATSSETFTGYEKMDKQIEGGVLAKNTTLIFTINKKDIGLIKFFGLANVNLVGATSAGSDRDLYCRQLQNVKGEPTKAYDFSDGGFYFGTPMA